MDDMEGVVRKFSLITAVLSFFYKFVMCIVFWMASIDLVKAKDDEERKKLLAEVDGVLAKASNSI